MGRKNIKKYFLNCFHYSPHFAKDVIKIGWLTQILEGEGQNNPAHGKRLHGNGHEGLRVKAS